MKLFFKFLLFTLLNNSGELDNGESEATGAMDNLASLESKLEALESEETSNSDDETESENGQELDSTETPEDALEKLELEESGDSSSTVLNYLNQLGVTRNGLPVEFENIDDLKDLVSKGYDYTQKTMELSENRKTQEAEVSKMREEFESEKTKFQEEISQHSESMHNYKILQNVIGQIHASDPELFSEIDNMFMEQSRQFQPLKNPELDAIKGKLSEVEKRLLSKDEQSKTEADEKIRTEWSEQLGDVQKSYGAKLRQLGVKPNWKEVQSIWAADTNGKMTAKQALFAVHGESISKAMDAHSKMIAKRKAPANEAQNIETENENQAPREEESHSYMDYLIKKSASL